MSHFNIWNATKPKQRKAIVNNRQSTHSSEKVRSINLLLWLCRANGAYVCVHLLTWLLLLHAYLFCKHFRCLVNWRMKKKNISFRIYNPFHGIALKKIGNRNICVMIRNWVKLFWFVTFLNKSPMWLSYRAQIPLT